MLGIGRQLKTARLAAGHTQESLAKAIGVTKGAIGNYENEISHPREEILYSLMRELNVDANTLFAWKEQEEPPVPESTEAQMPELDKKLLEIFRGLSDEDKGRMLERAEILAEQNREQDILSGRS